MTRPDLAEIEVVFEDLRHGIVPVIPRGMSGDSAGLIYYQIVVIMMNYV